MCASLPEESLLAYFVGFAAEDGMGAHLSFFLSIFAASHSEFRLSMARYEFREYYVLSCVTLAL